MTTILGIKLENRIEGSKNLQKILTKHGCCIKTRIGLHSVENGICAVDGIILLEVIDDNEAKLLEEDILTIRGSSVQMMFFPSPIA